MIKLFIGAKGSGKTKTLIELANNATNASNGSVVCIEKGDKLTHDITYKARLVDTDAYKIYNAESLYGFIAVSGLKMIQKVNLEDNRNLFVVSVILIAGVGGMVLNFGKVTVTSVACALILGILTNILTHAKKDAE